MTKTRNTIDRVRWLAAAAVLFLGSIPYGRAGADTLAIVHTGCVSGDTVGKCTGGRYKARPVAGDLVRVCGSGANCWSAGEPLVRPLGGLPGATLIDACTTAGVPDQQSIPYPWTEAGDPCKNWAPTAASTFVAAPTNTTGTFKLTWTPPTQNTDGSALTDLAGFWIYSAANGSPLGKLAQIKSPTIVFSDLSGYGPGSYQFALSAYNAAGVESSLTNAVPITVVSVPKVPGTPGSVSITRVEIATP